MADGLDYPGWIRGACRDVVRMALAEVAENGLPEPHHFVVTFASEHPAARLPSWLADQYPQRMTIILQHQFWNLEVIDDGFAVDLAFGGKRERVFVPFGSLISFADPAVELAFVFTDEAKSDEVAENEESASPAASDGAPETPASTRADNVVPFDFHRRRTT